jgi:hypothetical protein
MDIIYQEQIIIRFLMKFFEFTKIDLIFFIIVIIFSVIAVFL